MRHLGSSLPVAASATLLFAATVVGGCVHAPPAETTPEPPAWIDVAPAARVVANNARDERRCRRETPLGSRVERVVCRTEAEERLRDEAAAERVRWGTSPTF